MSKERLEKIEKNLDPLGYGMGGHLISVNDIYWLVGYAKEQSERVQELERKTERYREATRECIERMNEGGAGTRSFVYEKLIEVLERNNDA